MPMFAVVKLNPAETMEPRYDKANANGSIVVCDTKATASGNGVKTANCVKIPTIGLKFIKPSLCAVTAVPLPQEYKSIIVQGYAGYLRGTDRSIMLKEFKPTIQDSIMPMFATIKLNPAEAMVPWYDKSNANGFTAVCDTKAAVSGNGIKTARC
ncbi:hypothetical protein U1Q18_011335 [Sarracenia purpurea var. burkii]